MSHHRRTFFIYRHFTRTWKTTKLACICSSSARRGSCSEYCLFSNNKASFFKAFNSIYGKIGRSASEEVTFELIKSKRLSYQFLCME